MRGRAATAALTVLLASACGAAPVADPGAPSVRPGEPEGTVTVLAAASLTDVFTLIGDDLESAHPGLDVVFSFAASSSLAAQVAAGAPSDVFAAASSATMDQAVGAGTVRGRPEVFARNELQLVVPPDNPGRETGLADLADEDLTVALCAPEVPCGAAAERLLAEAGVQAAPDTLEQDVRAVLAKVLLGEVDAALVYRTDVLSAGDEVSGIDVPGAAAAGSDYLIAQLDAAPNPVGAAAFVAQVLSAKGQADLADAGFQQP